MADKDPFAEFGGSEVPASAPTTTADPFAEFGGLEVSAHVAETPSDPTPEEPGFLEKAGTFLKEAATPWGEYSPTRYIAERVFGDREASTLERGARATAENMQQGALLGTETPGAYVQATGRYLKDAVTPGVDADFDKALADTRAGMAARDAEFPVLKTAGEAAGTIATTVATGGLSGLAAKAAPTIAAKLGQAVAKGGLLKKAAIIGTGLAAEGAAEGVVYSAAHEVDDTIAKGDWSNIGEKLYSSIPAAAATGAKWNTILGGGGRVVLSGIKKLRGAVAGADDLELKVANGAEAPRPGLEGIHDPTMPLRSSEIVDSGSEIAIAARKQTTPEIADAVRREALPDLERQTNRALEIEDQLDFNRRLATKNQFIKEFQDEVPEGVGAFDSMLAEAGLDPKTLRKIAKDNQGEGGGAIKRLAEKIEKARAELSPAKPKKAFVTTAKPTGARELDLAADEIEEAAGPVTPITLGKLAAAMEDVKRATQKVADQTKNGAIHEFLLTPSENLRLSLEDPNKFGEAFATAQKLVNKEWSADIDRVSQPLLRGFTTDSARKGADPHFKIEQIALPQLDSLLSQMGKNPAIEPAEEALRARFRQRGLSFAERLRWGGDTLDIDRKLLQEYATVTKSIENQMNRVGLANRYAAENVAKAPGVGDLVKGMARGAVESTPIVGGVLKADREIRGAWASQRSAEAAGAALGLKKAAAQSQERLNKAARIDKVLKGAVEPAIRRPIVLEKVDTELQSLDDLNDPDSEDYKKLQSRMEDIEANAGPEFAQAYLQQFKARNDFLLEKAGPRPEPTVFDPNPKRELDDDTRHMLGRYMAAADDPLAAIERIGAGEGSAEDIETVQGIYSSMWEEFQQKAVSHLLDKKVQLSYDQRQSLSETLGIALNADADPGEYAFWQGIAQGTEMVQGEQGQPAKMSTGVDTYKAKSDRLG